MTAFLAAVGAITLFMAALAFLLDRALDVLGFYDAWEDEG
jgi:hypothetical protein